MSPELWSIIGYFGSAIAGGAGSYIFTRNKYKAEVQSARIDSFDKSLDAYKKMYEDMIGDLKNQNLELIDQKKTLITEKQELKNEIISLKEELSETRQQIITLTNFVLASAIKRADGGEENILTPESIKVLKNIMGIKSEE